MIYIFGSIFLILLGLVFLLKSKSSRNTITINGNNNHVLQRSNNNSIKIQPNGDIISNGKKIGNTDGKPVKVVQINGKTKIIK